MPTMAESTFLPVPAEEELRRRFAKIKPPMTASEAVVEASRCLFCFDAPCVQACPASIDIPMFIRQIMSRNITGAAKTILTQNILGKSCAYVCPTEMLCEGSCVYQKLNKQPIDIGRLQGVAVDHAIDHHLRFFEKGLSTGKRVAVIGGGPAGLACAHELTRLGHTAVVFEGSEKVGGLNRYGVAPYKYSNPEADKEAAYINEIGFEIRTGRRVTSAEMGDLEKNFDAIFLGVGLGGSQYPKIPGENKKNVFGAAEFIYHLRDKEQKISVGRRVVIVGAGNTAIDAAVGSAKLGAHVTLVYRRSEKDQSAYDFEVDLAKQHGVVFQYLTSPVSILGADQVEGVECVRNRVEPSKNGEKSSIAPVAGSNFVLSCDMVVFATGQEKRAEFFSAIPGLELERGKVKVNKDFQTANQKYFAGGDCVNGGKEVVHAATQGRDAARGINSFLQRRNL